jgi:hypothetical protein
VPELGGAADEYNDAGADERRECDWRGRERVAVLFGRDDNDGGRFDIFGYVIG